MALLPYAVFVVLHLWPVYAGLKGKSFGWTFFIAWSMLLFYACFDFFWVSELYIRGWKVEDPGNPFVAVLFLGWSWALMVAGATFLVRKTYIKLRGCSGRQASEKEGAADERG